jgi:hypothetical protein
MMHLLRHHYQYCLNSLQRCGDGCRLSRPPCQQSTVLSKAGLAFDLVAFFVATVIITAATATDAVAVAITHYRCHRHYHHHCSGGHHRPTAATTVNVALAIAIAIAARM